MQLFLTAAQILISILLIVVILLQQKGTALGAAFGAGDSGSYTSRRGFEGKLFQATKILGTLFILLTFLNLLF